MFNKGDFVEVSVTAESVRYWDSNQKIVGAEVQYAPQEIVRLWSARDANVRAYVATADIIHSHLPSAHMEAAHTIPLPLRPTIATMRSARNLLGDEDDSEDDVDCGDA